MKYNHIECNNIKLMGNKDGKLVENSLIPGTNPFCF